MYFSRKCQIKGKISSCVFRATAQSCLISTSGPWAWTPGFRGGSYRRGSTVFPHTSTQRAATHMSLLVLLVLWFSTSSWEDLVLREYPGKVPFSLCSCFVRRLMDVVRAARELPSHWWLCQCAASGGKGQQRSSWLHPGLKKSRSSTSLGGRRNYHCNYRLKAYHNCMLLAALSVTLNSPLILCVCPWEADQSSWADSHVVFQTQYFGCFHVPGQELYHSLA